MKSSKRLACFGALVLALVLPHAPAWPQGPTPSIGAPAPTSPPAVLDRPTLVPDAGDPVDGDEVTLPAKPAAILSGSSTWDEAFATLKKASQRIEDELAKAGIGPGDVRSRCSRRRTTTASATTPCFRSTAPRRTARRTSLPASASERRPPVGRCASFTEDPTTTSTPPMRRSRPTSTPRTSR